MVTGQPPPHHRPVRTPFGRGMAVSERRDGVVVVQLGWATAYLQRACAVADGKQSQYDIFPAPSEFNQGDGENADTVPVGFKERLYCFRKRTQAQVPVLKEHMQSLERKEQGLPFSN